MGTSTFSTWLLTRLLSFQADSPNGSRVIVFLAVLYVSLRDRPVVHGIPAGDATQTERSATGVRIARELGMHVVIVSADKDLMQLVGEDVLMWDTMRNKVVGPTEVPLNFWKEI